jgi:hypothetical protein
MPENRRKKWQKGILITWKAEATKLRRRPEHYSCFFFLVLLDMITLTNPQAADLNLLDQIRGFITVFAILAWRFYLTECFIPDDQKKFYSFHENICAL